MPFSGKGGAGGECVAHEAHISLHQLVETVIKRQPGERANRSPTINKLLCDISRTEPLCARFCWTASRILLEIPAEMWPVQALFWDVFGLLAGHAARAGDNYRSGVILKRCRNEFARTNNWRLRSYIANAMMRIGHNCVLRDVRVESTLAAYRIKCESAMSILGKITEPMGRTIKWIFNAWAEVGGECRSARRVVVQSDAGLTDEERQALADRVRELTYAVVREAFPLLRIYEMAEDQGCADAAECWPYWCQTIECVLPTPEWSLDEVDLVATPIAKAEIGRLIASIRPFVSRWKDPVMRPHAEQQIARLERSLSIVSAR